MKLIWIIAFLATMAVSRLEAAVSYVISENPVGVQISYSGKINTLGFSPQGAISAADRYIEIAAGGIKLCDFENFQSSPLLPDFPGVSSLFRADDVSFSWLLNPLAHRFNASSSGGDTFGFYVFDYVGSYSAVLNLPFSYVSETPVSGFMQFEGETLSSMGINANGSFQIFLPGGESVSGIVVVPEPTCAVLSMLAGLGILVVRRR